MIVGARIGCLPEECAVLPSRSSRGMAPCHICGRIGDGLLGMMADRFIGRCGPRGDASVLPARVALPTLPPPARRSSQLLISSCSGMDGRLRLLARMDGPPRGLGIVQVSVPALASGQERGRPPCRAANPGH
jgi:hypothetical protein